MAEGQLYGARGVDCELNVRSSTMHSTGVGVDMCFEKRDKHGGLNLVLTNILCINNNDSNLSYSKRYQILKCRAANSVHVTWIVT